MKTVFFRLDAGAQTGLGHLFRCISIAKKLRDIANYHPIFLISENDFTISELKKFNLVFILKPENKTEEQFLFEIAEKKYGSLLFIDKIYPYTSNFILNLKVHIKIVMFHNICEGSYLADIFILPSAHTDFSIIENPVWKTCPAIFYQGAEYVVINEEAIELKKKRETASIVEKKIVITTGGSDPKGILIQILDWLKDETFSDLKIIGLYGSAFIEMNKLEELKPKLPEFISVQEYSFKEITDTEVILSTFGVSTYEFMFAGIPIFSISHALANAIGSKNIEKRYNALSDFGLFSDITKETFIRNLVNFVSNKSLHKVLSENGKKLIDGKGGQRVAEIIINAC